jgi:putative flippase GtrA
MNIPLYEIGRFAIVGLSGAAIDFSITWFLRDKVKWNQYVANSIGFVIATTNNFIWNKFWTFHNVSNAYLQQYSLVMLIAFGGLLLNNAVLWVCNRLLRLNFYLSKAIASGVVAVWNYTLNKMIAFR